MSSMLAALDYPGTVFVHSRQVDATCPDLSKNPALIALLTRIVVSVTCSMPRSATVNLVIRVVEILETNWVDPGNVKIDQ